MDSAQQIAVILTASGAGAVLLATTKAAVKWLTGGAARERERDTDDRAQRVTAIEERLKADRRADAERTLRIQAENNTAALRHLLIVNGITPPKETP